MKIPYDIHTYTESGARKEDNKYVKKRNEDCRKSDIYRGIFITADGIGGHSGARVASRHATLLIYDSLKEISRLIKVKQLSDSNIMNILNESILECNKYINVWGQYIQSLNNCGTTLDGILINSNKIFGVHIGDGTVYKFNTRKKEIHALTTTDKSDTVSDGLSNIERDIVNPSVVSNYIGQEKIQICKYLEYMSNDDIILMATDGFTKKVHEEEIKQALSKPSFDEAFHELKKYCRKPEKMKDLVERLRSQRYHIHDNIFHDDTTFIMIRRND
jgi:PPM family protein phosphatase